MNQTMETSAQPRNLSRETLGKFFYDLAKIVFTALVAGSIVSLATIGSGGIYWILIAIGSISTFALAYIGFKIIR